MATPTIEEPALFAMNLLQRAGPIPDSRLTQLMQRRELTERQSSTETSTQSATESSTAPEATFSCGPKDTTGVCERMVAASPDTTTIPVVLGVVIPLTFAFVLLVILHRRHVRRLRQEDAEDKHKSLDFGMDEAVVTEKKRRGKGRHNAPELGEADVHHSGKRDRGLSLDLSVSNPYLLPPELQQSRESLHSLSRSVNTGDDKYRATNFIPDDGSLRSPSSHRHRDDASIRTYSTLHRAETESTKGLLPNGHRHAQDAASIVQHPLPPMKDNNSSLQPPTMHDVARDSFVSTTSSKNGNVAAMRASNNYLGQYISGGAKKADAQKEDTPAASTVPPESTAEHAEEHAVTDHQEESSKRNSYFTGPTGFDFGIPPNTYELSSIPEPTLPQIEIGSSREVGLGLHRINEHELDNQQTPQLTSDTGSVESEHQLKPHGNTEHDETPDINIISSYEDESDYYDEDADGRYDINEYKDTLGYDPRRLTLGVRPLPPDDPTENPEERATRIRSFYKEYFEETTKPGGEKARLSYFDGSENYIDSYYGTNNHSSYGYSYAQNHHYEQNYGYSSRIPSVVSSRGPPGRHRATISNGSFMSGGPGPRAYSSASQRMPGHYMRQAPKKRLPPPKPLQVLPTPSMLKEDSMLPNAIDYAPPQVFKNQRAGTPDGLRGGSRPYSPGRRGHNPLVSSFDDLSVLPSPHQLRKSGTFSTLDFAPPRFAAPPTGSDSGSIRSNRSGTSAMQLHNIRSGAYRLSRIPKEVVGTREQLADALKPQWNAR